MNKLNLSILIIPFVEKEFNSFLCMLFSFINYFTKSKEFSISTYRTFKSFYYYDLEPKR